MRQIKLFSFSIFSALWMLFAAQSTAAEFAFDAKLTASPQFARPGVERTLRIDGLWPNGCAPNTATVLASPTADPTMLNVIVNVIFTVAPCTQAVTPFAIEVKYTPAKVGKLAVNVATNDGRTIGNWSLVTSSADGVGLQSDLSGMWFEQPNAASIMALTHNLSSPDLLPANRGALVGTWNLFDNGGGARWFVIHSSRRVSPSVIEAVLDELFVPNLNAPLPRSGPDCPIRACPLAGFVSTNVGTVRIEIRSSDQIVASARKVSDQLDPVTGQPAVRVFFETTMARFKF